MTYAAQVNVLRFVATSVNGVFLFARNTCAVNMATVRALARS